MGASLSYVSAWVTTRLLCRAGGRVVGHSTNKLRPAYFPILPVIPSS
jgi:hypothetical protein